MRRRIEAAIESMIAALDAMDAPTEDLEDDDPAGGQVDDDPIDGDFDNEPSLGSFDRLMNQEHGWIEREVRGHAPYLDRELDPAEREGQIDDGPIDTDEREEEPPEGCLAHDDVLGPPKSAAASIAGRRGAEASAGPQGAEGVMKTRKAKAARKPRIDRAMMKIRIRDLAERVASQAAAVKCLIEATAPPGNTLVGSMPVLVTILLALKGHRHDLLQTENAVNLMLEEVGD